MWLMGCPNPYELQQSWEFTFMKVFTHTQYQTSIEKNFHQPVSELPAKQHGRYGPFGLYRLHCLANNSETGQWKFSWWLFGLCVVENFQKSELPTFMLCYVHSSYPYLNRTYLLGVPCSFSVIVCTNERTKRHTRYLVFLYSRWFLLSSFFETTSC